jgi:3'-5' exoribonuclease
MAHTNISEMQNGNRYSGQYVLVSQSIKATRTGSSYLEAVIGDATGMISAKKWDTEDAGDLENGCFVEATFNTSVYKEELQATLESVHKIDINEVTDPSSVVPVAPENPKDMIMEIWNTTEEFKNEELKQLTQTVIKENKAILLTLPGAMKVHHAVIGGLLYHIIRMLRTAKALCTVYPNVDRDLLCAGVIMHDVGKIWEFTTSPSGLVADYSVAGCLEGHLYIGARYVSKKCDELGISAETSLLMEHMILSHHGEPEYGSAVRPMFLEAELLHYCDAIDADTYITEDALKDTEEGTMSGKVFALDNRRLYKEKSDEGTDK